MKKYKIKGFIDGSVATISYGTNPLFAIPMYKSGLGVGSVFIGICLLSIIYCVSIKFQSCVLKSGLRAEAERLCVGKD